MGIPTILFILGLQGANAARTGDSKIVGGKNVKFIQEYPYLVKVKNIHHDISYAGILLTLSYALTCCHCIFKLPCQHTCRPRPFYEPEEWTTYEKDWTIVAGTVQNRLGIEQVVRQIKKLIHHPRCALIGGIAVFDLGLGELLTPFNLTNQQNVMPMGLLDVTPEGFQGKYMKIFVEHNVSCESLGWGMTNPSDKNSIALNLQVIKAFYFSQEECSEDRGYDLAAYYHVCVASFGSTCYGDAGAPLVCGGNVIGILSMCSSHCGDGEPSIYQSITPLIKWVSNDLPFLARQLRVPIVHEKVIPVTCPMLSPVVAPASGCPELHWSSKAAMTLLLTIHVQLLQSPSWISL